MGKRAYFLGCVRDLAFRKRAVLLLLLFTSAIAQLSTTSLGVVVSDPAGAVIGGVQIKCSRIAMPASVELRTPMIAAITSCFRYHLVPTLSRRQQRVFATVQGDLRRQW